MSPAIQVEYCCTSLIPLAATFVYTRSYYKVKGDMMSVTAESFENRAYLLPDNCSPEASLVKAALVAKGLETPMIENGLSRDEK